MPKVIPQTVEQQCLANGRFLDQRHLVNQLLKPSDIPGSGGEELECLLTTYIRRSCKTSGRGTWNTIHAAFQRGVPIHSLISDVHVRGA